MRLSPAERQEVETLADRAGLTLASYLRSRALETVSYTHLTLPTSDLV